MVDRMTGKVALVTGIGAGIGKATAHRFAAEGAVVIGCDVDPVRASASVAEAAEAGLKIDSVDSVDLTSPSDVRRFVAAAESHGRIDVLVNAAAIPPHMAPVESMSYDGEWRPTIQGEVDLVFLACREAWPLLRASGRASIINFASVNASRGSRSLSMAHCASKGAVRSMTKQLAVEGGPDGIRANCIVPGLVQTAATAQAGASSGSVSETIVARTLRGRLGVTDDIAWCAVYLGSDESAWVTGSDFTVDGGVLAV